MDELPPKAVALLQAARESHDPDPQASERVRKAMAAALAGPALTTDSTRGAESAAGAGKGAGLLSSTMAKVVAVLTLAGGAALWTYTHESVSAPQQTVAGPRREQVATTPTGETRADPPPPTVPAQKLEARAEPSAAAETNALRPPRSREPTSSSAPSLAQPARVRPRLSSTRARRSAPEPEQVVSAPARAEPMDKTVQAAPTQAPAARGPNEELSLMRTALARLNAGDTRAALDLLAQHARRYPGGVMREEREGLRAIALCRAGQRSEGLAAQRSFLSAFEGSPMAARVRSACKSNTP